MRMEHTEVIRNIVQRSEEVRFMLLSNLNELKNEMVSKNWTIFSFLFRYK